MPDLSIIKSLSEKKSIKEITATYLVAIIFIAFGIYYQKYLNEIRNDGTKTKGKVARFETHQSSDGKTMYAPILQFSDNGLIIEEKANGSSSNKTYKIGQNIDIYYLKKGNKYEVQIDSFIWNNFGNIFIILGLAAIGLGSYFIKVRVSFENVYYH
jgi:hypothetical protein